MVNKITWTNCSERMPDIYDEIILMDVSNGKCIRIYGRQLHYASRCYDISDQTWTPYTDGKWEELNNARNT